MNANKRESNLCSFASIRVYSRPISSSSDASHFYQISKYDAFQRLRGADPCVATSAAKGQGLDQIGVFVEGGAIAPAGIVVEVQLYARSGFGVAQFEFPGPWRIAVLFREDLEEHQLVAEVGEVLQCPFAGLVVQKIGDDDHQPPLWKSADEFADHRDVIGWPRRFHCGDPIGHVTKAMPPAGREHAMMQSVGEPADLD